MLLMLIFCIDGIIALFQTVDQLIHLIYTLKKLIGLWFNGFTAFSVKPLRIATGIGALSAGIGFLYGLLIPVPDSRPQRKASAHGFH